MRKYWPADERYWHARRAAIAAYYAKGNSLRKTGKRFGISASACRSAIRKYFARIEFATQRKKPRAKTTPRRFEWHTVRRRRAG